MGRIADSSGYQVSVVSQACGHGATSQIENETNERPTSNAERPTSNNVFCRFRKKTEQHAARAKQPFEILGL